MALWHFLHRRSCSRIHEYGFPKPMRWLSSDSEIEKASQVKKKGVPKDQRAVVAESYVKKYMESNPGLFPKVAHIQNVVGVSGYMARKILTSIKERMLETTVQKTQYVPDNGIDLHSHYKSDLDAGQVKQCDEKLGKIMVSLAIKESECSSDSKVSTSSDKLKLTQCIDQQENQATCSLSVVSSASIATSESESSSGFTVSTSLDSAHTDHSFSSSGHEKLNLTECFDQQEIITSCSLSPNSSVAGNNVISTVPADSKGACRRLSSLFAFRDDAAGSKEKYGKGDLTVSTSSDSALMQHSCSSSEHDKLSWTQFSDEKQNDIACSLSPDLCVEMNTKSAAVHGGSQELRNLLNLSETGDDAVVYESKDRKVDFEDPLNRFIGNEKITNVNSLFPSGILQRKSKISGNRSLPSSWENQNFGEWLFYSGANNLMGSEDTEGWNEQASPLITDKSGDIRKPGFFQDLEEAPMPKDQISRHHIKGLMDCIKGSVGASSTATPKEKTSYWKTDESFVKSQVGVQAISPLLSIDKKERNTSEKGHIVSIKDNKSQLEVYSAATSQSFENKERNASKKCHTLSSKHNPEGLSRVLPQILRTCADKISSLDFSEPAGESRLSASNDKEESDELGEESSAMQLSMENKAVVKFVLVSVKEREIADSFKKYGDVLKVKISSSEKGDLYTTADVYFKTREGLLNLLEDADPLLRSALVAVEAAGEDTSKRIPIPSLIGDLSVPAAVVKNPTRTVKIRQLTPEISSHDVVATLESRGSRVTGVFFSTKYSIAYVEFDEEDDKEAILAEHCIDVCGKKLLVSRIDVPRTTVIRVSFHSPNHINVVIRQCRSLAPTYQIKHRKPNIIDVHFKIGEWPNMLKILNSLNETTVHGHKLKARPASVIPPPILETLWCQPEERTHIKKCMEKLLQEFEARSSDLPSFLLE